MAPELPDGWENAAVTQYVLDHYLGPDVCALCGNSGRLDTTQSARSPRGERVGRVDYCLCPNGQAMRAAGVTLQVPASIGGVPPPPPDDRARAALEDIVTILDHAADPVNLGFNMEPLAVCRRALIAIRALVEDGLVPHDVGADDGVVSVVTTDPVGEVGTSSGAGYSFEQRVYIVHSVGAAGTAELITQGARLSEASADVLAAEVRSHLDSISGRRLTWLQAPSVAAPMLRAWRSARYHVWIEVVEAQP